MNQTTKISISVGVLALVVAVSGYFLYQLDKSMKQQAFFRNLQTEELRLNVNIKMCQGYTGQTNPKWEIDKDNRFICSRPSAPTSTPVESQSPFKLN